MTRNGTYTTAEIESKLIETAQNQARAAKRRDIGLLNHWGKTKSFWLDYAQRHGIDGYEIYTRAYREETGRYHSGRIGISN